MKDLNGNDLRIFAKTIVRTEKDYDAEESSTAIKTTNPTNLKIATQVIGD